MPDHVSEIEQSIMRMTASIRAEQAADTARSFGEEPDPDQRPRGWWVLACGDALDRDDYDQREHVRERLLVAVRLAGLALPENIWVWDDENRAQLVISTVPSLKRANILADRLRQKGLTIRVKRENF